MLLVEHWTNSRVAGSSPGCVPLRTGLGQACYICMPLSPSSIAWYRPKSGYFLRLGS